MPLLILYIDETGSRHPDKRPSATREGRFAIGGFIITQDDEGEARRLRYAMARNGYDKRFDPYGACAMPAAS